LSVLYPHWFPLTKNYQFNLDDDLRLLGNPKNPVVYHKCLIGMDQNIRPRGPQTLDLGDQVLTSQLLGVYPKLFPTKNGDVGPNSLLSDPRSEPSIDLDPALAVRLVVGIGGTCP